MKLFFIIRNCIKLISLGLSLGKGFKSDTVVILMYHRVRGDSGLELDIKENVFSRQMEWLEKHTNIVSINDVLSSTTTCEKVDGKIKGKLRVVLTFDDAYEDFYTNVWPILKKLEIPAVLYTPTQYIENPEVVPLSKIPECNSKFLPVTWDMLAEMNKCPLVTIGAHSHTHREFPSLSSREISEEIAISDQIFQERLGFHPSHFAYPRGAWSERCEQVIDKRYESIALVSGGGIGIDKLDPLRLPRVPVLKSDQFWWFRHRVMGRLGLEQKIIGMMRRFLQERRGR